MPKSRRRVRKPARTPSALWRTQQALLDAWLQDSPQGQQLLRERTLEEARVIGLPGDQMRIEIWPTSRALAGAPQASQAASAR
jgi:hypothetical protein